MYNVIIQYCQLSELSVGVLGVLIYDPKNGGHLFDFMHSMWRPTVFLTHLDNIRYNTVYISPHH